MRLFVGDLEIFQQATTHNQIAEILRQAFFDHFRYFPHTSEVNSWRNSLRALALTFAHAKLEGQWVILEYQLPLTSMRLDCMLCGQDLAGRDHAAIIELKQWEKCGRAIGASEVTTWVGGAEREVLHPSVQVGQYQTYLQDTHTAFYDGDAPVALTSCAYLHNYKIEDTDELVSPKFSDALSKFPIFTDSDVDKLGNFLRGRVEGGNGAAVIERIENSKYRPSKKLMSHVGNVIRGKPEYVLLDEQLVVYDRVIAEAKASTEKREKTAIIVKGGPGTGKSVIALNLMADLLLDGHNAHYATGSRAFTETLRKIIGARGSVQFKYFNSYGAAEKHDIDVLIADESHRIRETSNSRFTPKAKQAKIPQIQELLRAGRICVFFIDDVQVVRPNEIGSVEYIKCEAEKAGAKVLEYQLEAQFRCAGSDGFVNWIDNTLGVRRTANALWQKEERFEFKVFDTPYALEKAIREKSAEGHTARLTAGFCWKWSNPNKDGTLPDDVVVGDFKMPWDARPEATHLAPGIPKASLWAYDPKGIDQVGCVYTAQGFEFDYVGVIFGPDLRYDFDTNEWIGHAECSADSVVKRSKENFLALVRNTYRVLMTRGLKGCYVHFMDKDTERFFKSRME